MDSEATQRMAPFEHTKRRYSIMDMVLLDPSNDPEMETRGMSSSAPFPVRSRGNSTCDQKRPPALFTRLVTRTSPRPSSRRASAWIANSAPEKLKATYFAVMASFTNLALSASQLGTKYLNELFVIAREVKDPVTREVKVPADYGQLGELYITATLIGLIVPLAVIFIMRAARLRGA
jgi:hypothetical protein